MGTWEGHISPGFAFYTFGIVYCFQNSWKYFTNGRKFHRREMKGLFGKIYSRFAIFISANQSHDKITMKAIKSRDEIHAENAAYR